MNFYSVSSDGRVVNWKLVKNELQCQDAVLLKIPGASVDGPKGTQQQALSESQLDMDMYSCSSYSSVCLFACRDTIYNTKSNIKMLLVLQVQPCVHIIFWMVINEPLC